MINPHEKLAESLEVLRALQKRGVVACRIDPKGTFKVGSTRYDREKKTWGLTSDH